MNLPTLLLRLSRITNQGISPSEEDINSVLYAYLGGKITSPRSVPSAAVIEKTAKQLALHVGRWPSLALVIGMHPPTLLEIANYIPPQFFERALTVMPYIPSDKNVPQYIQCITLSTLPVGCEIKAICSYLKNGRPTCRSVIVTGRFGGIENGKLIIDNSFMTIHPYFPIYLLSSRDARADVKTARPSSPLGRQRVISPPLADVRIRRDK